MIKALKRYIGYIGVCLAMVLLVTTCGKQSADTPSDTSTSATRPSSIQFTGGGGFATSASYRARISIGAPTPMGSAAASRTRAQAGPNLR